MAVNENFLHKARALFPKLNETKVSLSDCVEPKQTENGDFTAVSLGASSLKKRELSEGDSVCLDFGDHETGYLTLNLTTVGSHPDAPVLLRVTFAERLSEFFEDVETYHGWVSKAWVQTEQVHLDVFPCDYTFPRRYAFRYVKIEVSAMSQKFRLIVSDASVTAVSSADEDRLLSYQPKDKAFLELDRVAVRTLHECMQTVFEDGPKRDRRLWLGDLRLEALANYQTYRQNDLVKQGLYLFAGDTLSDGRVAANMFVEPEICADDVSMFDYSLFFVTTLRDYVLETDDKEVLSDLYPTAVRQIELAASCLGSDGIIQDRDALGWCFVDWNMNLNKQASAHGIFLYALLAAEDLASHANDTERVSVFRKMYQDGVSAAKTVLFDASLGVFVSGEKRQVSYASQCWLILGGVLPSADEAAEVLRKVALLEGVEGMVTPYMYHQYIDALLYAGMEDEAKQVMEDYWGGMVRDGADTFFELYRPGHPNESPYGGTIVNSYCHAWSCAPAYFIRKYGW